MTTTLRTISPIDGGVCVERPLASSEEVDRALAAARAAQAGWKRTPLAERAALLGRAVDAFVAEKEGIAAEITRQDLTKRDISHQCIQGDFGSPESQ